MCAQVRRRLFSVFICMICHLSLPCGSFCKAVPEVCGCSALFVRIVCTTCADGLHTSGKYYSAFLVRAAFLVRTDLPLASRSLLVRTDL